MHLRAHFNERSHSESDLWIWTNHPGSLTTQCLGHSRKDSLHAPMRASKNDLKALYRSRSAQDLDNDDLKLLFYYVRGSDIFIPVVCQLWGNNSKRGYPTLRCVLKGVLQLHNMTSHDNLTGRRIKIGSSVITYIGAFHHRRPRLPIATDGVHLERRERFRNPVRESWGKDHEMRLEHRALERGKCSRQLRRGVCRFSSSGARTPCWEARLETYEEAFTGMLSETPPIVFELSNYERLDALDQSNRLDSHRQLLCSSSMKEPPTWTLM